MTEASASHREQRVLDRAAEIDSLVSNFITELRVHVDLLRTEIENQESKAP